LQVKTQFERLSMWLQRQHRSVERVKIEQNAATHLISTAEYELGLLRRELGGLALEPDNGIARLSDIDILAAKVMPQPDPQELEKPSDVAKVAAKIQQQQKNGQEKGRKTRHLQTKPLQLHDRSSDAA